MTIPKSEPYFEIDIHRTKSICKRTDIPARYILSFLTFWGMCLQFAHRVCLSVTIVAMVNHTAMAHRNGSPKQIETCPSNSNDTTLLDEMGPYNWSPSIQGVILGSYYYGYISTQIIGGRLAELYGGKWMMGSAIFIGSVLTIFTPLAADFGVGAIVTLRIIMGLIHGVCTPTVFALFAEWAPQKERSTLVALCLIGDHVGTILSMPLAGFLCEHGFAGGWPSVFYILGFLGGVWFVFWCYLAYSLPDDHPRISRKELDYIKKDKSPKISKIKPAVPWRKIVCSRPVWSIAITGFASSWGFTTLLTKLPTYLEVIMNVSIQKNGLVNSLVYVCCSVTLLASSFITDRLRNNTFISDTTIRKIFQLLASIGPALFTALIPYAECDATLVTLLLTLSTTFLGMTGGGHISIAADMAPAYAGTIFGLVNCIASSSGILSPLVAGLILDSEHSLRQNWNTVFYLSSGIYILGAVTFTAFASADLQPWASNPEPNETSPAINYVTDQEKNTGKSSIFTSYTEDLENSYKYGSIT